MPHSCTSPLMHSDLLVYHLPVFFFSMYLFSGLSHLPPWCNLLSTLKYINYLSPIKQHNIGICIILLPLRRFPGGSDGQESAYKVGDSGSISGSGWSPGEGNSYPFQYPCLENPMNRVAWLGTVHGVAKTWTQLSD